MCLDLTSFVHLLKWNFTNDSILEIAHILIQCAQINPWGVNFNRTSSRTVRNLFLQVVVNRPRQEIEHIRNFYEFIELPKKA